jgi:hypothetical protein
MTNFMEPSDLQPGDTVWIRGDRHRRARVIGVVCGFATCAWHEIKVGDDVVQLCNTVTPDSDENKLTWDIFHTSELEKRPYGGN